MARYEDVVPDINWLEEIPTQESLNITYLKNVVFAGA